MENVISLEDLGYIPLMPERINIETFIYIIKSGGHTSTTTNKEIPQDLIDTVKKYLLD
ncbi:CpaF family protein, partial [Bacillus thuringiensis]|nr:CpaF family protein [Bacillus thuringiensis]